MLIDFEAITGGPQNLWYIRGIEKPQISNLKKSGSKLGDLAQGQGF